VGDPAATGLRVPDVTLTIRSDDEYLVVTSLFSSVPLGPNSTTAGDPAARGLRVPDMTWTIRSDDEYLVVASPLPHDGTPCLAYTLVEADR